MNLRSERRVAVIVGGSGQIGRAIAHRFVRSECDVAIVSRGLTETLFLNSWTNEETVHIKTFRADVRIESEIRQCVRQIWQIYQRVDFLIYTPAIPPDMDVPLADYSSADWDNTIKTYFLGFIWCLQEALPLIERQGQFCVLSSAVTRFTEEKLPPLNVGHYAAVKAALDEFCKWARREVHERDAYLSRVAPAAVDVPFHRNAPSRRRPLNLIPVQTIAERIVCAALEDREIDEEIIP